MHTIRAVLLPVLLGLGIIALLGLLGSSLFLFREASALHPALGWVVLGLLLLGVVLLLVVPLVRVLRLPRALDRPASRSGVEWERFLRRYGRRLLRNPHLERGYEDLPRLGAALSDGDPALIQKEIEGALAHLDVLAKQISIRYAEAVFSTTAISQSGRLDTAIVLSAQFRMVRETAEVYAQRPGARELLGLYGNVGATAFLAAEIQDSELLAVLGAPVTAGITSFIPVRGADPLVSLLVTSLLDGSANAFLTLRIGALARRYSGIAPQEDRRLLARSASLEATTLLSGVVSQGAGRVARLTRKLIIDRAAQGTSRAARGMAGLGVGLFEKIVGVAEMAGREAVEATASGVRYLSESLRFWETVAAAPGKEEASEPAGRPDQPVPGS
jgi:hypothetical protein